MARGHGPKDWRPGASVHDPVKIFEMLGQIAPSVSFQVQWEPDPNFRWDGDGPDPAEEGYVAYDVLVRAVTIVRGKMIVGEQSLGGSYKRPTEDDPDIHGYLPQMLEEAVEELQGLKLGHPVANELERARQYLKQVMKIRYEAERRAIERERGKE